MYNDGGKKFLNMTAYGINDVKITNINGATYDVDAQCLVLPSGAAKGSKVTYSYKTGHGGITMDVTITISGESSGKYPGASVPQTTTPPQTQPPTTKPSPTEPPATKPQTTTAPKETTSSVIKPTDKPGQITTSPSEETPTEPSGEITSEDIDNDGTTTDAYVNPTIDSDDIGPKDIMAELKPILIAVIGVVVLISVVIVVIIIVSGKKNGKTKSKKNDKDKYQYNNRIKY